jgi:hypothetical protein
MGCLYTKNNKKGFFVLTMVLLVCASVLIVVTGMILRSIGDVQETANSEMSLKAWSTVNSCGEYALLQLSTTTDGLAGWEYASTTGESLSVGSSTCYIYPVVASGTDKIIKASSTVAQFTKKIVIDVATNTPNVLINSWEEVADF